MATLIRSLDAYAGWADRAACSTGTLEHDERFFINEKGPQGSRTPRPSPSDEAIAICRTCPVLLNCLTDALEEPYGIFGGATADQRRQITRLMGRGASLQEAFTSAVPWRKAQEDAIEAACEICAKPVAPPATICSETCHRTRWSLERMQLPLRHCEYCSKPLTIPGGQRPSFEQQRKRYLNRRWCNPRCEHASAHVYLETAPTVAVEEVMEHLGVRTPRAADNMLATDAIAQALPLRAWNRYATARIGRSGSPRTAPVVGSLAELREKVQAEAAVRTKIKSEANRRLRARQAGSA